VKPNQARLARRWPGFIDPLVKLCKRDVFGHSSINNKILLYRDGAPPEEEPVICSKRNWQFVTALP
jgi:hypothetical protein